MVKLPATSELRPFQYTLLSAPIFVISQVLDEINMETTVPSSVLEGIKLKTVFLLLLLLFFFFFNVKTGLPGNSQKQPTTIKTRARV